MNEFQGTNIKEVIDKKHMRGSAGIINKFIWEDIFSALVPVGF